VAGKTNADRRRLCGWRDEARRRVNQLEEQQSEVRAIVQLLNTALEQVEEAGYTRQAVKRARNE
jgi:hypothetical protein